VNPAVFLGLGPCTINGVAFSTCSTTSNTAARRRFTLLSPTLGPAYASVNTMDDGAVAHYNGMLVSLQRRAGKNFTLNVNYTYSNCISDADFGAALAGSSNSQPFNRHADWGPCVFDTRHNFNASLVANSSVKGRGAWTDRLLSDWQIAPLVHASSGQPLNVILGKDNSLTLLNNDRPNLVLPNTAATNPVCNNGTTPCVQFVNPAAFLANAPGTFGNLGHNALRGPHTVNIDAALSRTFKLTERYSLQARADAFNIFNHPNFVGAISPAGTVTGYTTFSNNMSASTFGRIQAAFDPRIVQFALKLFF
jgi:hypothetical protein